MPTLSFKKEYGTFFAGGTTMLFVFGICTALFLGGASMIFPIVFSLFGVIEKPGMKALCGAQTLFFWVVPGFFIIERTKDMGVPVGLSLLCVTIGVLLGAATSVVAGYVHSTVLTLNKKERS